MITFSLNKYYKADKSELTQPEINSALQLSGNLIELIAKKGIEALDTQPDISLIGVGNDAAGRVYSLLNTKFCLKVSPLGKHVGKHQEKQFELNDICIKVLLGRKIKLEGAWYNLTCSPAVAVAADESYAYTLMIRLDNTIRLWDEENIPFEDKDHWDVLKKIKRLIRNYGGKDLVWALDVNGNNLMLDIEKKKIFLIDPYVPAN